MNHNIEDDLTKLEYDGHIWEFGHFGEKNNGFSAYGFRQDGIIIRVTSKYEAELIAMLFQVSQPSFTREVVTKELYVALKNLRHIYTDYLKGSRKLDFWVKADEALAHYEEGK